MDDVWELQHPYLNPLDPNDAFQPSPEPDAGGRNNVDYYFWKRQPAGQCGGHLPRTHASVNIPAGVTVTFKNHASHAPVVWLVQGGVTMLIEAKSVAARRRIDHPQGHGGTCLAS
jgi:hypothetical protein